MSTQAQAAAARGLGALTLGLAAAALVCARMRFPRGGPAPRTAAQPGAARALHGAAALLAASVLADSGVEHARAHFSNPGMFTPLLSSSAVLLAGARGAAARGQPEDQRSAYRTALAAGLAGTAFHVRNLLASIGGLRWGNLFYGAPLGAPAALSLAGLLGLAALGSARPHRDRRRSGRALCMLVSAGLAGTTAEAALLHFRGAFQNPFMWLPVTLPPVAAASLAAAALAPPRTPRGPVRMALGITGMLGLAGVGFHVRGVGRQMGGWRNWRQNIASGPPLSAPPSFAALALAGLAALSLLDRSQAAA